MEARGGGRIVNGLSAGAFMPGGIYGVSKFALHGLTVNLASELGGRGINVNAIAPGPGRQRERLRRAAEGLAVPGRDRRHHPRQAVGSARGPRRHAPAALLEGRRLDHRPDDPRRRRLDHPPLSTVAADDPAVAPRRRAPRRRGRRALRPPAPALVVAPVRRGSTAGLRARARRRADRSPRLGPQRPRPVAVRAAGLAAGGSRGGSGSGPTSGPSDWSEPATFETGLLEPADWSATWIEPDEGRALRRRASARPDVLRHEFVLDDAPTAPAPPRTPPPTASTRRSSTVGGSATSS